MHRSDVRFSQTEHIHVISTQSKKWKLPAPWAQNILFDSIVVVHANEYNVARLLLMDIWVGCSLL